MDQQVKKIQADGNPQLDPALVVEQTQDVANLTCPICLSLVNQPFDCVECDSTYCEKCIHDWFQLKKSCPQCRAKQKPKKAHKLIRAMLNSLKLHCVNRSKGCEAIISYNQIATHKCDIFCEKCGIGLRKEEHDCMKLLFQEVKRLKEKDSQENSLFGTLKSQLLIVKNPHEQCSNKHELIMLNRSCNWFCNECMVQFNRGQVSWLCSYCDHDVCLNCITPSTSRTSEQESKLVQKLKNREIYIISTCPFPCKSKCKPCVYNLVFSQQKQCKICGNNCKSNWCCSKCDFNVCTRCSPISIITNSVTKPVPRFNY